MRFNAQPAINRLLPKLLKEIRLQKNLGQRETAKKIGLLGQQYSNFENGTGSLSNDLLKKVMTLFDCHDQVKNLIITELKKDLNVFFASKVKQNNNIQKEKGK